MLGDVAGEGDLIETNRASFAEVDCPVLIIYGERDRILSANAGPRIAEAIPGAELRMLPGWGHSPILDHADEVAEMVVSRCSP
jgi:pimeloyl-ACP methyl ester carboxylesterase